LRTKIDDQVIALVIQRTGYPERALRALELDRSLSDEAH
jgi:hypothetical protein